MSWHSQKEIEAMKEIVKNYPKCRLSQEEKKYVIIAFRQLFSDSNLSNDDIVRMFYIVKRKFAPENSYNRTRIITPEEITFLRECINSVGEDNLTRLHIDDIIMKFKVKFPNTTRSLAAISLLIRRLPIYEKRIEEGNKKKKQVTASLNKDLHKELVDLKELIESTMNDFADAIGRVIEVIGLALKEQQSNK